MCDSFLTLVRGVTVIVAIADYQSLFAGRLGVGRVITDYAYAYKICTHMLEECEMDENLLYI